MNISGEAAIVGIGETGYFRGSEQSVPELVLSASMEAIRDAGLKPSDIDAVIPPPGYLSTEEIAANLGIPEVTYAVEVRMGGASPTASLQSAAMALSAGIATNVLITFGWNGYSAFRRRPDSTPSKRKGDPGPFIDVSRNFYAP